MKLHEQYYVEKAKVEKLIAKKNQKSDFYNGIYDRYTDPVLTREHIPVEWKYDVNPETNPYFMERLGVNAVFNSGAIELNGKYYLIARVEGNDRKSFFGIAESDSPVDGFRFWDYPVLLDDICPEETAGSMVYFVLRAKIQNQVIFQQQLQQQESCAQRI